MVCSVTAENGMYPNSWKTVVENVCGRLCICVQIKIVFILTFSSIATSKRIDVCKWSISIWFLWSVSVKWFITIRIKQQCSVK